MPATDHLAFTSTAQPIRLAIDASSHLAGVLRGVVFGLALLAPVIATAFGPAVRQPYRSEATLLACQAPAVSGAASVTDCTPR